MTFTKSCIRACSLILAAVLALFAMGCSSEAQVKEIDTSNAIITDGQASATPLQKGADESKKDVVSSLNIGILKDIGSLHPLYLNNEQTENVLSLIFEPAIKLDASDLPSSGVIESWEWNSDKKIYTFHVRKNVYYHDSESTVTADDILYAFEKIMDSSASECRYSQYKGCVKSYEKTDDYTFTVSLKRVSNDIFYLLSFPVFQKSVYGGLDVNTLKTPVGTGAYKVKSFDVNSGMELVANDNWWKVAGDIEKIYVKFYSSQDEINSAYRVGDIDTLLNIDMNAAATSGSKSTVYYATTQYYDALIVNCKSYPTNIKEVRQGLNYLIDRSALIKQSLQGEGYPTMTPLRLDKWYTHGIEPVEDSAKKAMKCFKSAGFSKDGSGDMMHNGVRTSLKLIYCESSSSSYRSNVAAILRTQLSEAGINLDIEKLSENSFLSAIDNGEYDLALCSFYNRANDDISMFFGSSATLNYGKYEGESVDDLIKAVRDVNGEEEATAAYTKLYSYLIENVPHIGLYFRTHSVVLPSGIPNVGLLRARSVFADINTWKTE